MKRTLADRIIMKATEFYVGKRITMATGAVPHLSTPVLIAANHPTTLDPLLLQYALKLPSSALLTEAAFSIPGIGKILRSACHLPVGEKSSGGKALIEAAAQMAQTGRPVAIFPEGRLSPRPGIAPLRSGAVRIASTARIPILPVGISASSAGTREISLPLGGRPQTGRYIFCGWYIIRIGTPLVFDIAPEDRHAVDEGTARLAAAIRHLEAEAMSILAFLEGREYWDGTGDLGLYRATS